MNKKASTAALCRVRDWPHFLPATLRATRLAGVCSTVCSAWRVFEPCGFSGPSCNNYDAAHPSALSLCL